MSAVILSVKDLTVSFDGFKAVSNLDLDVQEDELRVVIGPNGAGKTTLLDMICGKTKPTSGSIRFKDLELTRLNEYNIVRAGVGRKFQTPSTYEDLVVFENLQISYPDARGVVGSLLYRRDAKLVEKINNVAQRIYLRDHLLTKAGRLSHGQKQWLEIGMLLAQEPKLLLVDEPVAGMTDHETRQTAELLKEINRDKTVIVVEHDMTFVREIGVKVTCLHEGTAIAEGTIDQVSANERVIEVYLGR